MTEKTDFAEKLHKALKDAGFFYTGLISLTDEEFNSYKGLSPKAMAEKYATAHAIAEKSKIFTFMRQLYDDTIKGQKTFKLRESIIQAKLLQNEYMWAFQNCPKFFQVQGINSNRQYVWVKDSKPIFSDANIIYDFVKKLVDFKLTQAFKTYIRENIELGFDNINATLNPSDDCFLHFKIKFYINSVNTQISTKKKPKAPVVFSKEISRTAPIAEQIVEEKIQQTVEERLKMKEFNMNETNDRLITSLDSALMYQKLLNGALEEYYKAKFDAQEKYIDALQEQILFLAKTGKS